jgi:type IX secretion system substrate protein
MKKFTILFQRNTSRLITLVLVSCFGLLIFQGQDNWPYPWGLDDSNPLIDQPTREAFSHFSPSGNHEPSVITDAQGFDNFDVSVNFYESMAVSNPLNPQWIFFGVNASPQNAWNTTNGGLNWTLFNPAYPGGTCCDPWATYTNVGTLIYGSGVSGQYVYRSTNNGNTWTAAVLSVSGNDRNTLACEQTGTGPYANYVYAAITPGNFGRSTDLGATWTTTYSYSNTIPGVMIVSGPDGGTNGGCVIYVTNTGAANNVTYTFHRSLNGGATFTVMSSLTVAGDVGTFNSAGRSVINNMRTRPYPMIAMDNSNGTYRGRLYLAYASNIPAGSGNKPDIKFQYSTDQGATWSAYVVVNDNPNPTQSDQWFPAIDCDRNTGRIWLQWYDDRSNGSTYQNDVYGSYSTTGGTTWAANIRVTNATWLIPNPACPANSNCYRGDYNGMAGVTAFTGAAVWTDHRNGTALDMMGYFPDFAMRTASTAIGLNNLNDSTFVFQSIPAVKGYTNSVRYSATIAPAPTTGTVTLTFLHRTNNVVLDSLTSLPDSLRLRVRTSGGVTGGPFTISVLAKGPNGAPVHLRTITLTTFVGIEPISNELPSKFYLYQNYPNPFNPTTNIKFDLPKSGHVKITVYDIAGKVVEIIADKDFNAGSYIADFKADNLSSGIYFYKIETADFTAIRKMMLIK